MSDTPTQDLIDDLRRSVRRWKTLALTLLVGLGLVVVLGVGATVVQAGRARQAEQAAREAEMQARQQAEVAQEQARRNLYIAHMTLAQQEWEHSDVARAKELLEQPRPKDAAKDAAGK
jgi:uncharacterized protein HemX